MMLIEESNMQFFVDEQRVLQVEKNSYLQKAQGVMACEFISWNNDDNVVCLVEAKTSSPKPNNGNADYKKRLPYFTECVRDKFVNSFQTFVAAKVGRFAEPNQVELNATAQSLDLSTTKFKFYLVIKNHKLDWLAPVNDLLQQKMHPFLTCWNIRSTAVKVLNEDLARSFGLVK